MLVGYFFVLKKVGIRFGVNYFEFYVCNGYFRLDNLVDFVVKYLIEKNFMDKKDFLKLGKEVD